MRDSSGKTIEKVTGKTRGNRPLQRRVKQSGFPEGYPLYEIVTVGGITEIIEYRKMEPIFYISDAPAVRAEFAVAD